MSEKWQCQTLKAFRITSNEMKNSLLILSWCFSCFHEQTSIDFLQFTHNTSDIDITVLIRRIYISSSRIIISILEEKCEICSKLTIKLLQKEKHKNIKNNKKLVYFIFKKKKCLIILVKFLKCILQLFSGPQFDICYVIKTRVGFETAEITRF